MERVSSVERNTKETNIKVEINLDGGDIEIETGIGFFDHMLHAFSFYAGIGLKVKAKGDLYVDGHHTVEDIGIVLGMAIKEALGDRKGIHRFGTAFIPMDDALCRTCLDISNRPYLVFNAKMPQEHIGDYESCLTIEFMRAVAVNLGATIHQECLYGDNSHHITEALFKSFGVALKEAIAITGNGITSTKGVL